MNKPIIIDEKIEKVIIKYSVIITLFTFVLSKMVYRSVEDIVDVFLGFIFQFDFDKNGVPDISQLKSIDIHVGKYTFSLGKLIYVLIKLAIQILIVMFIIKLVIKYTNFVKV